MKNLLLITACLICIQAKSQYVSVKIIDNDISQMKNLQIRPNVAFGIPITDVGTDASFASLNVDAQYWYKDVLDVRAGVLFGFVKGGTFGATYHLKDNIKLTNYKFVTSRSTVGKTTTTKFLKTKANSRVIFGPCVDFTVGGIKDGGLVFRTDLGFDYQSFSKATAELGNSRYQSSRNSWLSLKLAATIASMNYQDLAPMKRILGIGALVNLNAVTKPWKKVCISTGIQMGAMKLTGLDPADADKGLQPILSFYLGASINI